MTVDAEHLEIGVFIPSTQALPENVIHLSFPRIANSPTMPTLPIVPNQDFLPDGIPVRPASILLREAWALSEFPGPPGGLEEAESLWHQRDSQSSMSLA